MIPTVIVVGLAVGRWWAIPLAGLGWTIALLATHTMGGSEIPVAFAFGAANCAAGVVAHQLVAWPLRRLVR